MALDPPFHNCRSRRAEQQQHGLNQSIILLPKQIVHNYVTGANQPNNLSTSDDLQASRI